MKFVCERCQTKYSIADEKVRQKVLKIRCKTCENVITIRDAVVVSEPAAPRMAPPPAPIVAAAPRSVEWHLAVSGQQSGPFGLAALVTRILAADKNDEVYVWNEHLDGWKEPKQIPEVAAEMRVRAAASETPPVPPAKRPTPGLGRNVGGPAPVVGRGGRSGAMAAVASFAEPGEQIEEEKTQISPLDASLMLGAEPGGAPTRPSPNLSLLAKSSAARGDKAEGKRAEAKAPEPKPPEVNRTSLGTGSLPPLSSNGHGRKTAVMGSSSGLEALDFSPAPAAEPAAEVKAPAAAANGVPQPVVGGSTSMLLNQAGVRASKPRHPAVKYIVLGGLIVGLFGIIAVVTLTGPGERTAETKKPAAPVANAPDPEAQARAEAEKYFKSMVAETAPPPASTKSVGPAPSRRAPERKREPEPKSTTPPPLAPPPVGGTPQPTGTGSRVTQRFAQAERQVSVPTSSRKSGGSDFDIQKFAAVFKQPDHFAAIKSCYERALKRDESLKAARIDILVTVSDTGNAKRVKVVAPPEFSQVSTCIQDSVRRWRFPADVKEYDAAFPLILQGKSE